MSQWHNVAKVEEILPNEWKVFNINQSMILVANLDGEFFAIEDRCSHDNSSLACGQIDGDEIICPRHFARFSLRTGEVTAPPAYEDLETFPTRLKDGYVQVEVG